MMPVVVAGSWCCRGGRLLVVVVELWLRRAVGKRDGCDEFRRNGCRCLLDHVHIQGTLNKVVQLTVYIVVEAVTGQRDLAANSKPHGMMGCGG
jgi:hypothetical protein